MALPRRHVAPTRHPLSVTNNFMSWAIPREAIAQIAAAMAIPIIAAIGAKQALEPVFIEANLTQYVILEVTLFAMHV